MENFNGRGNIITYPTMYERVDNQLSSTEIGSSVGRTRRGSSDSPEETQEKTHCWSKHGGAKRKSQKRMDGWRKHKRLCSKSAKHHGYLLARPASVRMSAKPMMNAFVRKRRRTKRE